MTVDSFAGGPAAPNRGDDLPPSLPVPAILLMCDRLLDEIGRRHHLFAWLRRPGGPDQGWVPVDAYYPGNRLVVVCRNTPEADDALFDELVPAHGLRLLRLFGSDLGTDSAQAALALQRRIAELGPAPARPVEAPADNRLPSRSGSWLPRIPPAPEPLAPRRVGQSEAAAAERGARFVAAHRIEPARLSAAHTVEPVRRTPDRAARRPAPAPRTRAAAERQREDGTQALAIVTGLALVAIVCGELYLGIARAGIRGGHVLLALGVALDACSRALGTIAARRAKRPDWEWGCALVGCPVVISFALFQRTGPVRVEPAPLAGFVAVVAAITIALAVLIGT
jgi:hypothetical protein